MGRLNSESFSRAEFACQCGCGFDTVDAALLDLLIALRGRLRSLLQRRVRVRITSGCRCPEHNAAVGGSENSQHLYGKAADIMVDEWDGEWLPVPPDVVADIASPLNPGGLGRYNSFTHIDSRNDLARWDLRSKRS